MTLIFKQNYWYTCDITSQFKIYNRTNEEYANWLW